MNGLLDRVGIAASATCSVHCAVQGLLPAALAVGLGVALGPLLEWTLVLLATGFAVLASVLGYRTHGSPRVALPLFVFAALLLAGRFLEQVLPASEAAWSAAAGIGLAVSHLRNLRACSTARDAAYRRTPG